MVKRSLPDTQKRAQQVLAYLKERYPDPHCHLRFESPWQLLCATVLSAQCTDERVNQVTPALFKRWPDAKALALANIGDIEEMIRSTGFFRNKAKNLLASAIRVTEEFGGKLPETLEELLTLPGVARKTANVVLHGAFGLNAGLAVDTHVKRISYRLGLTESDRPVRIEQDLMCLFPQEEWGNTNHRMVSFGREVCQARRPDCGNCGLAGICPKHEPTHT